MYTIFIIEDDKTIASLVSDNLIKWGFECCCTSDFSKVEEEFTDSKANLVLMDISLPFFNGFYWCEKIRKQSSVPIIFLSSRNENMDIVMAMNMGADDYVTKPFSMEVLIAKINALLRRAYSYTDEMEVLQAQGALLNLGDMSLVYKENKLELTKNEQRILKTLISRKNNVVSRDELIRELWDTESFIDDNTLTVNINRLRSKLSDIGLEGFIKTKKGAGYLVDD